MTATTEPPATAANTAGPRRRPRFAKLALFLISVFAAILVGEVALRLAGFTYFNPYIADEDVGFSLRPGAEGWWKKEALTYVRINSQGFRDREHTMAKPPDTLRIAVLGDSYVEAFQVPVEKTFWSVMERRLQDCHRPAKQKIEVLSFGISGFSTARELILLRKRLWQYSPDMIVLLVTTGNDIRDNSRTLNEYRNQPLPYFVLQDGKLTLDNSLLTARTQTFTFRLRQSFLGTAFSWLQNHSRILGLIYTAREAYQSRDRSAEKYSANQHEPGMDHEVYGGAANPQWENAWQTTEALFEQMRNEVNAKGARFLVVTGTVGVQVNPNPENRQRFMNRLGVQTLFYPEQRIKALGDAKGFAVLNLAPSFVEYADRNKVFLHGFGESSGRGHWNEIGHQLAGESIAREVCRTLTEDDDAAAK